MSFQEIQNTMRIIREETLNLIADGQRPTLDKIDLLVSFVSPFTILELSDETQEKIGHTWEQMIENTVKKIILENL